LRDLGAADAELLDVLARGSSGLLEVAGVGLVELLLFRFAEAQLDRGVLVFLLRPLADDDARVRVDDRDGNHVAVAVEHLGHADLLTDEALHWLSPSLARGMSASGAACWFSAGGRARSSRVLRNQPRGTMLPLGSSTAWGAAGGAGNSFAAFAFSQ